VKFDDPICGSDDFSRRTADAGRLRSLQSKEIKKMVADNQGDESQQKTDAEDIPQPAPRLAPVLQYVTRSLS
jgi:hypothetical protein